MTRSLVTGTIGSSTNQIGVVIMKEQTLRIEIKVDGVLIEVREFKTNRRDNITSFCDFLRSFKKDMGLWNFAKFFD